MFACLYKRDSMTVTVTVPGPPVGKGRPRFGKGRTYTPKETVAAELAVQQAWAAANTLRCPGAVALDVVLCVVRPQSHFKRDGSLSAEGLRHPQPDNRKPDVDNALKLVGDALNGRAWGDDVQITRATVERCWSDRAETVVTISSAEARKAA